MPWLTSNGEKRGIVDPTRMDHRSPLLMLHGEMWTSQQSYLKRS